MKLGGGIVLISFTVKNMLSFKDEATLDMEASSIKSHSYSIINEARHKILPVAAVYGANASGKTNLISSIENAMGCISGTNTNIVNPFLLVPKEDLVFAPFCKLCFLLKLEEEIIECEYSFSIMGLMFFYEELRCIVSRKKSYVLIYKREYNLKHKKWELSKGTSKFAKQFADEIKYINEMEASQNTLLITVLGKRARFPLFKSILDWAKNAWLYNEPPTQKEGRPVFDKDDEFILFIRSIENIEALNSFTHMINPVISEVTLQRNMPLKPQVNDSHIIDLYEEIYTPVFKYVSPNNPINNLNEVITSYESKGVWTAIMLFPKLHNTLTNGGLLIIDELENSLHPILMTKIINLFTSPETNPGQGQLIFTTHNALIMDKKLFRQDEIVFVEKDEAGASSIYRLSDIEGVRSDLDFSKNYIMGAFGAIPNL
jgi:AAA15 family ATPase/GTPase